eukprot:gene4026-7282_t
MKLVFLLIVVLSLFLLINTQDISKELEDIKNYNLDLDYPEETDEEEETESKPSFSEKKEQQGSWNNGNASGNFGVTAQSEKKTEVNPTNKKDQQASWNNGNSQINYGTTEEEKSDEEESQDKNISPLETLEEKSANVQNAIDPKQLLKETEAPPVIKPIGATQPTSWTSKSMKIFFGVVSVFVIFVLGIFGMFIFMASSSPNLFVSTNDKDTHYIKMPDDLTDEELDSLIKRNSSTKYVQSYKVPTTTQVHKE